MATANINGVDLYYEVSGSGHVPLVLVHGSWESHHDWDLVVPKLSERFRILTYDRRGHSRSERPSGQGSVREDVADLAGLIEHLDLSPSWVVGNSFGASIALRLAGDRPELMRGIIAHEPPLLSLVADDPACAPMLEDVGKRLHAVLERIASGDHAGAAEQFVETVAIGPGSWEQIPPESRQIVIENAPTFLDESNDPEQFAFDQAWIASFPRPILLTTGDESPPMFAQVMSRLAEAPTAELHVFHGSGHIPHATDPEGYVQVTADFIDKNPA